MSAYVALVMLMLQENIKNRVRIDSETEICCRYIKPGGLTKSPPAVCEEMLDIKVCVYHRGTLSHQVIHMACCTCL